MNSWLWHVGTSSLTRDQTKVPCVGNSVLAAGPPGQSPLMLLLTFTVAPKSSPCLFFDTIYLLGPLQLTVHCCRRSSGWTAPPCVSSAAVPSHRWRLPLPLSSRSLRPFTWNFFPCSPQVMLRSLLPKNTSLNLALTYLFRHQTAFTCPLNSLLISFFPHYLGETALLKVDQDLLALLFICFKKYLFIWLHQVLVVAFGIFDLCCSV